MKKNIQTLVRVRHRYDKILNAKSWDDLKMRDILLIPPTRTGKIDVVVVQKLHIVMRLGQRLLMKSY